MFGPGWGSADDLQPVLRQRGLQLFQITRLVDAHAHPAAAAQLPVLGIAVVFLRALHLDGHGLGVPLHGPHKAVVITGGKVQNAALVAGLRGDGGGVELALLLPSRGQTAEGGAGRGYSILLLVLKLFKSNSFKLYV